MLPFEVTKNVPDHVLNLLENIMIFAYQAVRSRNIYDVIMAVTTFYKLQCDCSHFPINLSMISSCKDYINTLFTTKENQSYGLSELFTEQSFIQDINIEQMLTSAKDKMELWPKIQATSIWKKVRKVMAFLSASALYKSKCEKKVDAKFVAKIEKEMYENETMFRLDMTHTILETLLLLSEKGYQIFITGEISSIFHSGKAYELWLEESTKIIAQSRYLCNPEPHGIDIHKFQNTLDKLLTQGSDIIKMSCDIPKLTLASIRNTQMQLTNVRAMFINMQSTNKTRRAPMIFVVEGDPGAGKTTFSDLLHIHYAKVRNKDPSFGTRFAHSSRAKHWDGFKSHQWSLLIDDIASHNPAVTKEMPQDLSDVLGIGNNAPFVPPMAAVEDKGKTPFTGELCVCTTNSPEMHFHHYFAVEAAPARRMKDHLQITVKSEFQDDNGMLDSTKISAPLADEYPNWWNIQVREARIGKNSKTSAPRDLYNKTVSIVDTVRFDDIYDFLMWYVSKIHAHQLTQDKIEASNTNMFDIKLCNNCFLPRSHCMCSSFTVEEILFSEQSFVAVVCHGTIRTVLMACLFIFFQVLNGCVFQLVTDCFQWLYRRGSTIVLTWLQKKMDHEWNNLCWYLSPRRRLEEAILCFSEFNAVKAIKAAGNKIYAKFRIPPELAALVYFLVTTIAGYKMWAGINRMLDNHFDQQTHIETGSAPQGNERENVWYNPNYEVSNFDVGRLTCSWKGLSFEQLEAKLLNNIVNCRFYFYEDGKRKYSMSSAICLNGQLYMTTDHSIPNVDVVEADIVSGPPNVLGSKVRVNLRSSDILRTGRLAFFYIQKVPPKSDVSGLLMGSGIKGFVGDAIMLGRNVDGSVNKKSIKALRMCDVATDDGKFKGFMGNASPCTIEGDCGSIYLMKTGQGPVIGAIHELGVKNSPLCSGAPVDKDELTAYIDFNKLIHAGGPNFKAKSAEKTLIELHAKSPVRYIDKGNAKVYGTFAGHRPHLKSRVQDTPLRPLMERDGFETDLVPPNMKGWAPIRNNMIKLVADTPPIDKDLLELAVQGMFADWCKIPKHELDLIEIYNDITIVNGSPGVRFVDAMPRSTSMGEPWNTSKKYFLDSIEVPGYDNCKSFTPEVLDRVEIIIDKYLRGERACPVFAGSLKDKAIPKSKDDERKVRMFMGAPADFTYVVRKYLLSFVRVMQRNKFLFESAPGIEAQCAEWDALRKYLTHFNEDRCVGGDFKSFDTSMPPEFLLAAFGCIKSFHELAGCDDSHLKIIDGIMYDICYPYANVKGDLLQLIGKNPSGHALTVTINSVVNCLYMRYCYLALKPNDGSNLHCYDFKDSVKLITYGDDNFMNVKEGYDWFNHRSISEVLRSIGVTYTMADKISESIPYVPIDEASFLKRKFRFEDELGYFVCPLEPASIIGSLMIGERSKFVSEESRICSVMTSANDEFFWHGRETFEEWHARLQGYIDELQLQDYMDSDLPTWDDLIARYKQNTNHYINNPDIEKYVKQSFIGYADEKVKHYKRKYRSEIQGIKISLICMLLCGILVVSDLYVKLVSNSILVPNWSSINLGCESIVNKDSCKPDSHSLYNDFVFRLAYIYHRFIIWTCALIFCLCVNSPIILAFLAVMHGLELVYGQNFINLIFVIIVLQRCKYHW